VRGSERAAPTSALAALAAGVILLAAAGPVDAAALPGAVGSATQLVTLRTVPATPGVRIRSGGRIFRTDAGGHVTLALSDAAASPITQPRRPSFALPEVLPTRLPSGAVARFGGFFNGGRTIGLSLHTRNRLDYVRLDGTPIPPSRVGKAELKSSTGLRVTVRGGVTPELQATRVVRGRSGLRSQPIEYAVESVDVGGGNVVHRAQRRFTPIDTRVLKVPLLLYALRFTSADALFGNPVGSSVSLRYPDGHVARLPLHGGQAEALGLPRGEYSVRVHAPGYSFERPVSLSRDQLVDLQVVSFVDFAVVLGTVGAGALALLIVGRPLLRRRLRRLLGLPLGRARRVARR